MGHTTEYRIAKMTPSAKKVQARLDKLGLAAPPGTWVTTAAGKIHTTTKPKDLTS